MIASVVSFLDAVNVKKTHRYIKMLPFECK